MNLFLGGWRGGKTAMLALVAFALAWGLAGCGPCRKPDPPPPGKIDPHETDIREADRALVSEAERKPELPPARTLPEGFTPLPPHAPGVETNLVDIPGWTTTTPPLGSKWGLDGRRTYRQDDKQVHVRLWRVETEKARMKPQFEIGYKHETRIQHVEMVEIEGYPVLINYHPPMRVGHIEIMLLDGWGKIDFTYHKMDVDEVKAFTRNFVLEELERRIASPESPTL